MPVKNQVCFKFLVCILSNLIVYRLSILIVMLKTYIFIQASSKSCHETSNYHQKPLYGGVFHFCPLHARVILATCGKSCQHANATYFCLSCIFTLGNRPSFQIP